MRTTEKPENQSPAPWRTPAAIGLGVVAGVLAGLFLKAASVPFGPVLLGWFVALAGAVVVPVVLCILATRRYAMVGRAYAASVAAAVVIASIADPDIGVEWWWAAVQFGLVFIIVGCVSSFASLLCALLKWEDKWARETARDLSSVDRDGLD